MGPWSAWGRPFGPRLRGEEALVRPFERLLVPPGSPPGPLALLGAGAVRGRDLLTVVLVVVLVVVVGVEAKCTAVHPCQLPEQT